MKRYIIYRLAFIAAIAVATTSCEDRIELDLPEGEKLLVVQGWITNEDRPHDFRINYTQPYFDSGAPPAISGAIVLLRAEGGPGEILGETAPGVYTYPTGGIPGESYRLEVTLPDGKLYYSAYEELRQPVPIDAIRWGISSRGPIEAAGQTPDQIYEVVIDTQEPAGAGDFYRWRLIVNGEERTAPDDLTIASDQFVDGNPIINFEPFFELFVLGDTVTIIQERITRTAYDFLLLVQQQTAFVGGPFDTPPAPIPGNVSSLNDSSERVMGIVSTAARTSATVIVGD